MAALRLEKLPHAVRQVAAGSLATVVLLVNGELWLRGRFIDEMWEQIPPIENDDFAPMPIAQIALRDHLALEVPEYDILAVTVDGRLFEYAKENRGWAWKWSQI